MAHKTNFLEFYYLGRRLSKDETVDNFGVDNGACIPLFNFLNFFLYSNLCYLDKRNIDVSPKHGVLDNLQLYDTVRTYDVLGSVIKQPGEGGPVGLPYTWFVVKVGQERAF